MDIVGENEIKDSTSQGGTGGGGTGIGSSGGGGTTSAPIGGATGTGNGEEKEEKGEKVETQEEPEPLIELRDPTTRPVFRLSVKLIDTYKLINKVRKRRKKFSVFSFSPFYLIGLL